MSQQKLADAVREREKESAVYQARITDWELGKDLPSLRQLGLIAVELGLSAPAFEEGVRLLERAALSDLPVPTHEFPPGERDLSDDPTEPDPARRPVAA